MTTVVEQGRRTVIDSKYGCLSEIDYDPAGTADIERATALLSAGKCTVPQYTAWVQGRDEYRSERARAAARSNGGGELRLYHWTEADEQQTRTLPKDKQRKATGVVCLGGLNTRFPVALHPAQWIRLVRYTPQIAEYLRANVDALNALGAKHAPEQHKPISASDIPSVTIGGAV